MIYVNPTDEENIKAMGFKKYIHYDVDVFVPETFFYTGFQLIPLSALSQLIQGERKSLEFLPKQPYKNREQRRKEAKKRKRGVEYGN